MQEKKPASKSLYNQKQMDRIIILGIIYFESQSSKPGAWLTEPSVVILKDIRSTCSFPESTEESRHNTLGTYI